MNGFKYSVLVEIISQVLYVNLVFCFEWQVKYGSLRSGNVELGLEGKKSYLFFLLRSVFFIG